MAISLKDVEQLIEKRANFAEQAGKYTAEIGLPILAGNIAGKGVALATVPSDQEVKKLQAEFVKSQMERALTDLKKREKLEKAKEVFGNGARSSLRI